MPLIAPWNLLALDPGDQVLAHHHVSLTAPGTVLVHVQRFTPGDPVPENDTVGVWREVDSSPVPGNPTLTETLWRCAVDVPPPFTRSRYDRIGLHRLSSADARPGRVLLFLPGAQCNGSLYTEDETRDFRLYLAHNGYQVFSLDYRIHFAPPFNLGGVDLPGVVSPDLTFMAPWDSGVFFQDVRTAVLRVKELSGADKIFLCGFSSGGQLTYFYASSGGQDDLAGLITIDGGPFQQGTENPPESLNIDEGRAALLGGDTPANRAVLEKFGCTPAPGYYSEDFGSLLNADFLTAVLEFVLDPQAPSPVPGFATASDYIASRFQNLWVPD
ncbi:MAG: hypothetical protein HY319_04065 [Armatimonadetes bacterium]|nr:hypothetical protein [Armatimonadota bacterium]